MLKASTESDSDGRGVMRGIAPLQIWDIQAIGTIKVVFGVDGWQTKRRSARLCKLTTPLAMALFVVAGCTSQPGTPYTLDTSPLAFVDEVGVKTADQRGRFREIICTINEGSGRRFPEHRTCGEILHRFLDEPPGSDRAVNLRTAQSKLHIAVVAGLGAECFSGLVQPFQFALEHLRSLGYRTTYIKVDGLSSSANNGRQIRDAVLDIDLDTTNERLILVGYSKGTPDIIEGLVAYPELQEHVAAVISIAGAVNGSPLSNDAPEWMLSLLEYLPGSQCEEGDGGAIESLKPSTRRRFTAIHKLPEGIRYYSLGTFARREQISTLLRGSYDKLSEIDPRNDGQMLFYDQIIPGGALLGFVKSDHWAVALPVSREHPNLAAHLVDRNAFPREIVLEAVVRHVEEQLLTSRNVSTEDRITLRHQD